MAAFVKSERKTKNQNGKSERRSKRIHENYLYTLSKKTTDGVYYIWVCEKRGKCKGRIWTRGENGDVVKVVMQHNHAAQAGRPVALRAIDVMRQQAATTFQQPQEVITGAVVEMHANVAALLPRKDSLKRIIRQIRNNNGAPALPQNLQDLLIPQEYKEIMIDGAAQKFLYYDSEEELLPGRLLIFTTQQNLHLLSQSNEWFVDGTFSTAPGLFEQLYTVHVMHFNKVIPVIYALLPNKTRATYVKFLQEVKTLQPGLNPQFLISDFETAASMQAFDMEFPGIAKTGCFFHLCQNVWKHVQREGLQVQYQRDHEVAQWIRRIPALAFVPQADVIRAFEDLAENPDFPQLALPIIDYFEDTYIGRLQRGNRRRNPCFPITLWNVYERTCNNQHRTNNAVEGWHRGFQTNCIMHFPNIYRFIDSLRRQQGLHNFEITQLIAGMPGNPVSKRYASIAVNIRTIVQDYANRDIIMYLRGIAYNFEF